MSTIKKKTYLPDSLGMVCATVWALNGSAISGASGNEKNMFLPRTGRERGARVAGKDSCWGDVEPPKIRERRGKFLILPLMECIREWPFIDAQHQKYMFMAFEETWDIRVWFVVWSWDLVWRWQDHALGNWIQTATVHREEWHTAKTKHGISLWGYCLLKTK